MSPLESELIKLIKTGNQKSFEFLFRTYYSRLCTFAFGYTRQLESAQDLVKDVFINLWNKRETLEIKSNLSGYLFNSVKNACINYLQRDKNRMNLSIQELEYQKVKIQEPLSDDYPVANILVKELENIIYSEVENLPDACKKIFELSRFEGLSHAEIAEKLQISENTVKVQIYKALKQIRVALYSNTIILFNLFVKK